MFAINWYLKLGFAQLLGLAYAAKPKIQFRVYVKYWVIKLFLVQAYSLTLTLAPYFVGMLSKTYVVDTIYNFKTLISLFWTILFQLPTIKTCLLKIFSIYFGGF